MSDYRLRAATLDDVDVLVHHRIAMFTDMGVAVDAPALDAAFRRVAARDDAAGHLSRVGRRSRTRGESSPAAASRSCRGRRAALPQRSPAFVYNVYTEPTIAGADWRGW